jgi:mono/diheme cytochrome c family protein
MLRRHWILLLTIAVLAVMLLLAGRSASAADAERGRALYDSRCAVCHDRSVHARQKRVAADFAAVQAWVRRWSADLGLFWGAEEIDDVAVYLNKTVYRHPCPTTACPVVSLVGPPR